MFPGPPLVNLTHPFKQQHPSDSRIHPSCPLPQTLLPTTAVFQCECLRTDTGRMERYGAEESERKPQPCFRVHLSTEQPWGSTPYPMGICGQQGGRVSGEVQFSQLRPSIRSVYLPCTYHLRALMVLATIVSNTS